MSFFPCVQLFEGGRLGPAVKGLLCASKVQGAVRPLVPLTVGGAPLCWTIRKKGYVCSGRLLRLLLGPPFGRPFTWELVHVNPPRRGGPERDPWKPRRGFPNVAKGIQTYSFFVLLKSKMIKLSILRDNLTCFDMPRSLTGGNSGHKIGQKSLNHAGSSRVENSRFFTLFLPRKIRNYLG